MDAVDILVGAKQPSQRPLDEFKPGHGHGVVALKDAHYSDGVCVGATRLGVCSTASAKARINPKEKEGEACDH
jgi:hypothetical protein